MGEASRRRRAMEQATRETAPRQIKVAHGYVHSDANLVAAFEDSREALIAHDMLHYGLLAHEHGKIAVRVGTDGLPAARNELVARVLDSDVDWLLWMDTDMGFPPEALYLLLQVAHPVERPIVGALCFIARQVAKDGLNGYRIRPLPTIFDWKVGDDGIPRFTSVPMYPVNQLVQVAATGSAFILIHRSVFERIGEKHGPTWYDRTHGADGKLLGEDVSFCVRASDCQIPIHVHTGVRTTHYKAQWLGELDHWRQYVPPPAEAETAVIVPVLNRWKNAAPFMKSLKASTGLANVYAVAQASDDAVIRAWEEAGATVLISEGISFAHKVNVGYAKTAEPWLFICGDDVKFHPGWLDHAQHVAGSLEASVVGTNDLGNPRVMSGEHATHLLISRDYVDRMGASWDGPGVVCHEGYRHWFVDDEIVTAAKQRGVWQMALGSVVEHQHPLWGKAADDDTYQLGQSFAEQDQKLFQERLAVNT